MGILLLLLPPRLQVHLHGSLPFGSLPQSWSQVVDQSPGYGATASSGGMTSPSTTAAGMSGYVPPPPGLTPIDFSNRRLLPPKAPTSRGLPTAPPGLPGVGRSIRLRGTAGRNTGAQMAQRPGGLAQRTQTLPTSVPCAPQMAPPLHQPLPGRLVMPYQQAVQPPKKPMGRVVASNPPQIKPLLWAVQVHRTAEVAAANPSVAQGACRRRRVHSRHIRRAVCHLGQCQVFHHQRHLKEPSLSGEVGQGLPSLIPRDWQQNFAAVVGRRTWSMCSGSITSSTLPPSRRRNGRGSRSSFSNTSSRIRRKPWASKKDARWILWPTSKTIFIRPRASTWMASEVSLAG